MAKVEELILKIDESIVEEVNATIGKLQKTEESLRKKCHRYKKHIKGMERGIKWRNEIITELFTRLGYTDEDLTLSIADFEKLLYELGYGGITK